MYITYKPSSMRGNRSGCRGRKPTGEDSDVTLIHSKKQHKEKNALRREQIPFPHNLGLLAGVSRPDFLGTTESFAHPSVSTVYIPSCKLWTNSVSNCPTRLWIPCDDGTHFQPPRQPFVYVFDSCSRCWKWLKVSVLRNHLQLSYVGSFHQ